MKTIFWLDGVGRPVGGMLDNVRASLRAAAAVARSGELCDLGPIELQRYGAVWQETPEGLMCTLPRRLGAVPGVFAGATIAQVEVAGHMEHHLSIGERYLREAGVQIVVTREAVAVLAPDLGVANAYYDKAVAGQLEPVVVPVVPDPAVAACIRIDAAMYSELDWMRIVRTLTIRRRQLAELIEALSPLQTSDRRRTSIEAALIDTVMQRGSVSLAELWRLIDPGVAGEDWTALATEVWLNVGYLVDIAPRLMGALES